MIEQVFDTKIPLPPIRRIHADPWPSYPPQEPVRLPQEQPSRRWDTGIVEKDRKIPEIEIIISSPKRRKA